MIEPVRIRLSPSRVEAWLTCPARWYFSNVEGFEEPETPQQAFGTAVHLEHEMYFGPNARPYQTDTPHGLLAWRMASKYPARDDFVRWRGAVEEERTHIVEGYTLEGRLDMNWLPPSGVPVVADHKTTIAMRYAKLEREDLFGHAQAPFYLLTACEKYDTDRASSFWLYADTTKSASLKPSRHEITKEEARDRTYTRMLPVVKQMVQARDDAPGGVNMPKNLLSCNKYNKPCPHLARCQPERYQAITMSFLASLEAEQSKGPSAPTPQPTPAPTGGGLFDTPPPAAADAASAAPVTNPADPNAGTPAINPPEGDKGGRGKGKRGAGEKGATHLSEADLDALAERVCDKLATRLMGGVK